MSEDRGYDVDREEALRAADREPTFHTTWCCCGSCIEDRFDPREDGTP